MSIKLALIQGDNVDIIEQDTLAKAKGWVEGYLSGNAEFGVEESVVILEPGWEVEVIQLDALHHTKRFECIVAAIKELAGE